MEEEPIWYQMEMGRLGGHTGGVYNRIALDEYERRQAEIRRTQQESERRQAEFRRKKQEEQEWLKNASTLPATSSHPVTTSQRPLKLNRFMWRDKRPPTRGDRFFDWLLTSRSTEFEDYIKFLIGFALLVGLPYFGITELAIAWYWAVGIGFVVAKMTTILLEGPLVFVLRGIKWSFFLSILAGVLYLFLR